MSGLCCATSFGTRSMTGWYATGTYCGWTISSMLFGRVVGSRDAMPQEGLFSMPLKGCRYSFSARGDHSVYKLHLTPNPVTRTLVIAEATGAMFLISRETFAAALTLQTASWGRFYMKAKRDLNDEGRTATGAAGNNVRRHSSR